MVADPDYHFSDRQREPLQAHICLCSALELPPPCADQNMLWSVLVPASWLSSVVYKQLPHRWWWCYSFPSWKWRSDDSCPSALISQWLDGILKSQLYGGARGPLVFLLMDTCSLGRGQVAILEESLTLLRWQAALWSRAWQEVTLCPT